MDAYQQDLLRALLWMVGALGSLGLVTVGWGIRASLERMDETDKKLEHIRELLQSELHELRDMHHSLDMRVTKIEERCNVLSPNHFPPS